MLVLIIAILAIAIIQLPDSNLHVIACDVGLGDAILIVQGKIQILTDGGPDNRVLECLGRYLPFWDKNIELVISTHPDADHLTGLPGVIKKYNVDKILINPTDPGTQVYQALENAVGSQGVGVINPVVGMQLRLGLIQLEIVSSSDRPKTGESTLKTENTNENSIVYLLNYGQFKGLFTGDMTPMVSDRLALKLPTQQVDYIKIPHHGSSNGITENLLEALMPKIGVISVGKNIWNFPRPEILEMLGRYGVKTLRTDEVGDIQVITDGKSVWIKK